MSTGMFNALRALKFEKQEELPEVARIDRVTKLREESWQRRISAIESGKSRGVYAFLEKIGLWGTTADTKQGDIWQEEAEGLLSDLDLTNSEYFNPRKKDGSYGPEDTAIEIKNFAENKYHFFRITKDSEGHISLLEAGNALLKALLHDAEVCFHVDDLTSDDTNDGGAIRSRKILSYLIHEVQKFIPEKVQMLRNSVTKDAEDDARTRGKNDQLAQGWLTQRAEDIKTARKLPRASLLEKPKVLALPTSPLRKGVFYSGSSVELSRKGHVEGTKDSIFRGLKGVHVEDSFVQTYDFGEDEVAAEYDRCGKFAVNMHVITNDTLSFGAISETIARATLAALRGQTFVLYIEPADKSKLQVAARNFIMQENKARAARNTKAGYEREPMILPTKELLEKYANEAVKAREALELQFAERASKLRNSVGMHVRAIGQEAPGIIHRAHSVSELIEWTRDYGIGAHEPQAASAARSSRPVR